MTAVRPSGRRRNRRELDACGRVLAQALADVVARVKPGVASAALNVIAEQGLRSRGATPSFLGYRGYPASLCVSINDEVVHGIPGQRLLKPGDLVGLDLGAVMHEWYADMAVTVSVGRASSEASKIMAVTKQSLDAALRVIHNGARVGDIGAAVQSVAESAGCSVVRDLVGHGVGSAVHEEPPIPNFGKPGTGPVLRTGDVLAIEPMVTAGRPDVSTDDDGWTVRTVDHSLAAHEERTVVVTATGCAIVTPWPAP